MSSLFRESRSEIWASRTSLLETKPSVESSWALLRSSVFPFQVGLGIFEGRLAGGQFDHAVAFVELIEFELGELGISLGAVDVGLVLLFLDSETGLGVDEGGLGVFYANAGGLRRGP